MKTQMEKNQIIFEVLEATGLNWTARKQPLQTTDGFLLPEVYGVMRSDNNQHIGIVRDRYQILQNHEMVEVVYESGKEVFDESLELRHPWNNAETLGTFGNIGGGSLQGGSRVFLQLELPELHIGKSGIKRFITVTNSHDGTAALGFGTSSQVICCQNTFNIANKDISKYRHVVSMQERIDEAIKSLRKVLQFEDKQMEIFDKASTRSFDKKHIEQIVKCVFSRVNLNDSEIATKTKNNMEQFSADLNKSIDEQGETLWALFNGVTRYTNHSTRAKDKDYSLMFGRDAQVNQKAFETMLGWLNESELVLA